VEIICAEINASNYSKGPTSVLFEGTSELILELHFKKVTVFSRLIALKTSLAFVSNLARLGQGSVLFVYSLHSMVVFVVIS